MNSGRDLLDGLAQLTGIRDAQRLEHSLLKTLDDIYESACTRTIRFDAEGRPRSLHFYDRKRDAVMSVPFDPEHPFVPAGLLDQALASGHWVADQDEAGRAISIFPMSGLKEFSICLVFAFDRHLGSKRVDQRLVESFLLVYRNFVNLIDDAQTDALTGLLNRKTFDDNFHDLTTLERISPMPGLPEDRRQLQEPGQTGVWLGVIDADDFKKINDGFGHVYGDEVLILLARLLKQSFRENDLVYRFGGEEFVVLAEFADASQAIATFDRLRRAVAEYPLPRVGRLTTSIGVTRLAPYKTASAALDEADQALYHAKAHGKNRVCLYDRLVEEGAIKPTPIEAGEIELF
ncbi:MULTISPECIES: diguanylate cyclase [unclassified Thioalkalivibrio]|uniref:GGDEF domain-containing protein n=1 Tax=unclassified Thioalkalivibrio TaxID=2621013 RepID=UPI00035FAAD1|nr:MULTISPECIES: GGDEF domain-containing protein [unclassified Thioalkalivibrio]